MKQLQPVIAPTPPPPSESATDPVIHDRKRSIEDMASSPGLRNSKTELRAELMRLEAEKEQLEIDKQRINNEKVRRGRDWTKTSYLHSLDWKMSVMTDNFTNKSLHDSNRKTYRKST